MTEKEQFTAMLTRTGVVWSESVWNIHVHDVPSPGATTVLIEQGQGAKNQGYYKFFTQFEFSREGQLLRVGVWE
jgi:hypothetical protein